MNRKLYFLIILCFTVLLPQLGSSNDYVVVKGDTLSAIAERELGDRHKWRHLAKINTLKIVKRNGISHVDLEIGQELKLKEWTAESVATYYLITKQILEKEIFEMAGIRRISTPITDTRVEFDPTCQQELRLAQMQLRSILFNLACQERLLMAREIFKYTKKSPLHFFGSKKWLTHRKTAFLLAALLDIESDGYFVRGKHGECGPYQIKVGTFKVTMKYRENDIGIILMTSHLAGMKCALTILKKRGNARDALLLYNSGSPKNRRAYANRVLRSFDRMLTRAARKGAR